MQRRKGTEGMYDGKCAICQKALGTVTFRGKGICASCVNCIKRFV